MDDLSESCESILTRRANQRHYCIVAQFVKRPWPPSQHSSNLGRETINLPGGRLAKVRYARIATKFRSAAK